MQALSTDAVNETEDVQTADDRLHRLSEDLSVGLIHEVVASAYDYVVGLSDFAPSNGRGLELYIRATENIRGRLQSVGWQVENISEVPSIASVADKVRIVCTTAGDGRVGKRGCGGPAIRDRGIGTLRLAGVENKMDPIPGIEEYLGDDALDKRDDFDFYYLILHVDSRLEEIRIELSAPSFDENGALVGWTDRIIIPPLSTKDEPPVDTTAAPAPDIEVVRKTA